MMPVARGISRLFLVVALLLMPCLTFAQPVAPWPEPSDVVDPPGLPPIGKWMIDRDGTIAHWLGEVVDGKRLREPVNVILIDTGANSVAEARARVIAAVTTAGYPVRFGHSAGYRALIGDALHAQLPAGRDDAFSNDWFELSNDHGRLFGPYAMGHAYVTTGAFSRERVRPLRWPGHGYASFNAARDGFATDLARSTAFRREGYVPLANALIDDPGVSTGDHDGRAVLLRAQE